MSNITQLFSNEIFDADAVVAMGNAYDLACQTLQNIGELEVDRGIIVRRIRQAAESRERDANNYASVQYIG